MGASGRVSQRRVQEGRHHMGQTLILRNLWVPKRVFGKPGVPSFPRHLRDDSPACSRRTGTLPCLLKPTEWHGSFSTHFPLESTKHLGLQRSRTGDNVHWFCSRPPDGVGCGGPEDGPDPCPGTDLCQGLLAANGYSDLFTDISADNVKVNWPENGYGDLTDTWNVISQHFRFQYRLALLGFANSPGRPPT